MLFKIFSPKVNNTFSILALCAVLFSTILTTPVKAMDENLVEIEQPLISTRNPTALQDLKDSETSRGLRKVTDCCKYRSSAKIIHNVYTECTRGLECIWNFLWCRGCKSNRRLEKDRKNY